jgi:hypothetical protein
MKFFINVFFLFLCPALLAQRNIEKKIVVANEQAISLEFDYPELIRVYTSATNELVIKGKVSLNQGESDEAFELNSTTEGNKIKVISSIRDKDKLPKRIMIKRGDQEYYFKTDNYNSPEVQKFIEENGREYSYMSNGIIIKIELDVYLPKGIATTIHAKYGLIEVLTHNAPLTILAQYGGVDVTIPAKGIAELTARTRYGEILTNLSEKPTANEFGKPHDSWTNVTYKLGAGTKLDIESKYGKIYLRRGQ